MNKKIHSFRAWYEKPAGSNKTIKGYRDIEAVDREAADEIGRADTELSAAGWRFVRASMIPSAWATTGFHEVVERRA